MSTKGILKNATAIFLAFIMVFGAAPLSLTAQCYYRSAAYNYVVENNAPKDIFEAPLSTVTVEDFTMLKGSTLDVSLTLDPLFPSENYVISVSNPAVATIDEKTITALKCGSTTLDVVSDSGKTGSCIVTVVAIENAEYTDFDYETTNKGTRICITGYTGSDSSIVVPDTIANLPVTAINASFDGCTFTSITLCKSITSVSRASFGKIETLNEILVDSENTTFASSNGVLLSNDGQSLVKYFDYISTSYTVPDTITFICSGAFPNCESLTDLTIPQTVTYICENALVSCENTVIHCYKNSKAHTYAVENSIDFDIISLDATDITVSGIKKRFAKGVSYTITSTISNEYTDETLIWSSSDDSIISVSNDGTVTLGNVGSATITVTTSRHSVTKSFDVMVVELLPDSLDSTLYHVNSVEDMFTLSELVNGGITFEGKTVKLESNIDMTSEKWIPIGSGEGKAFSGVFDGNNHSIKYQNKENSDPNIGLFGYIVNGGVKDLTVCGDVVGSNTVGIVAAYMLESVLYNCVAVGNISYYSYVPYDPYGYAYVGGLAGIANHCVIINCVSDADISTFFYQYVSYAVVGGLVGVATVSQGCPQCILNCYCTGNITVSGNDFNSDFGSDVCRYYVGGIAGYLTDDAVNNYFFGTITDTDEESKKIIGYAFGFVCPEYTSAGNFNGIGTVIIGRNYYPEGENAIGEVDAQYDTTGWTEGVSESDFYSVTDNSFLNKLNAGIDDINTVITEHREVLLNSAWADLVVRVNGESFVASEWTLDSWRKPVNHGAQDGAFLYTLGIETDGNAVTVGETVQLNPYYHVGKLNKSGISWKSSNAIVADVDENGLVTAKRQGNVIIIATDSFGNTAESFIQVLPNGATVSIGNHSGDYTQRINWWKPYSSATMSLYFTTYNCTEAVRYVWSSDSTRVKIDQNGNITNTGSFSRSATITLTAYDSDNNVVAKSSIIVIFYKFSWQQSRLQSQSIVSDNILQRNLSEEELELREAKNQSPELAFITNFVYYLLDLFKVIILH